MITLDDAALRALASNPAVMSAFPELVTLKSVTSSSCCGRAGTQQRLLLHAKQVLAGLPDERVRQLCALLNTDGIRIYISESGGVKKVELKA